MTTLTADDFNRLVCYFKRTAFRFETRDSYAVSIEAEDYRRWLAGEPVAPPTELPWFAPWLDQIRKATQQGRHVRRVRLLADPPTDYQRWELWATPYNVAAGEDVQLLGKAAAVALGLPLRDWWLFDDQSLAVMDFDDDGRPLGGQIVTDRAVVDQHRRWRDLAVAHSRPYDHVFARS